jgi:hypothetical protein
MNLLLAAKDLRGAADEILRGASRVKAHTFMVDLAGQLEKLHEFMTATAGSTNDIAVGKATEKAADDIPNMPVGQTGDAASEPLSLFKRITGRRA